MNDISLYGKDQKKISIGSAGISADDNSVVIADLSALQEGVYIVVWRVVSADGHPLSGAFPFEVGQTSSGTADQLLARVLAGINNVSPLGASLGAAKFLAFLGLVLILDVTFLTRDGIRTRLGLSAIVRMVLALVVLLLFNLG